MSAPEFPHEFLGRCQTCLDNAYLSSEPCKHHAEECLIFLARRDWTKRNGQSNHDRTTPDFAKMARELVVLNACADFAERTTPCGGRSDCECFSQARAIEGAARQMYAMGMESAAGIALGFCEMEGAASYPPDKPMVIRDAICAEAARIREEVLEDGCLDGTMWAKNARTALGETSHD